MTVFAAAAAILAFLGCSAIAPGAPTPVVFDETTPPAEPGTPGIQPTWVTQMPPSGLELTGRLILTGGSLGVTQWDLATGEITPVFVPPQNGIVNAASISPDEKLIVMAYGPPPPPGKPQIGVTSLYTVPVDGSTEPEPLIPGDHTREYFFTPHWSADGDAIFFGHYTDAQPNSGGTASFYLERRSYPEGDTTTIARDAFIPYLSRDGEKIAFITVDLKTYLNSLYIADVDGSNATSLLPPDVLWAIDSLAISPDGQSIIFAGDSEGPSITRRPAIYDWLGIRVAQAHNVPEDLWLISTSGGKTRRLTTLGVTGLAVDYSPDGMYVAFISSSGTYVMHADGSNLTRLDPNPRFGTIQWVK